MFGLVWALRRYFRVFFPPQKTADKAKAKEKAAKDKERAKEKAKREATTLERCRTFLETEFGDTAPDTTPKDKAKKDAKKDKVLAKPGPLRRHTHPCPSRLSLRPRDTPPGGNQQWRWQQQILARCTTAAARLQTWSLLNLLG